VWTIGGGHTAPAGPPIPRAGMTMTLPAACALLRADLGRYGARVEKAITGPIPQNVFDGFTDFDLNTGAIASGTVDNRWNAGDKVGAMNVLMQYVNAGGVRLAGLATRRAEERDIIMNGRYPANLTILVRDTPQSQGRRVAADSLPWDGPQQIAVAPSALDPVPVVPLPTKAPPKQNFLLDILKSLWSLWK
jgi:GH24 family phage-related lysozyme (muramidase)